MQHIIVRTSKTHHLIASDWLVNGAGYKGNPVASLIKGEISCFSVIFKLVGCWIYLLNMVIVSNLEVNICRDYLCKPQTKKPPELPEVYQGAAF